MWNEIINLLLIYPGDFDLLWFKFGDVYYIDKCLPMGCSIWCKVFEDFATFWNWLAIDKSHVDTTDHYLYDFIFAGHIASACMDTLTTIHSIYHELGVSLAEDRLVDPTTCLTFLGLQIDTLNILVRVPCRKSVELHDLLIDLLSLKYVTVAISAGEISISLQEQLG